MNKDEFEKYYESAEANEDSKSDTRVILFLVTVVVVAIVICLSERQYHYIHKKLKSTRFKYF